MNPRCQHDAAHQNVKQTQVEDRTHKRTLFDMQLYILENIYLAAPDVTPSPNLRY